MNILIVDDDNNKISKIIEVITRISTNFNVDTTGDVFNAQKHLKNSKYDLLLLDLFLPIRAEQVPRPDGGALLLKEIKRNHSLKVPTIIAGITQYEEHKIHFSEIWKLIIIKDVDWEMNLIEIISHIDRSNKFQSDILDFKKPTVIVEGQTDFTILNEAIELFRPDLKSQIEIKFQKSGGANWVAKQVIAWAVSDYKNKNGDVVKCIGLLDGDQAGIDANTEINRVIKSDSSGSKTFKVIKLKPDHAKDLIPLCKKGLIIPVTLEECYPASFWFYAENQGWLERRSKLDSLIANPSKWDKFENSLKDHIASLNLCQEEEVYLKTFKLSSKENVVKHIETLDEKDKRIVLKNFEGLIDSIIDYLFDT